MNQHERVNGERMPLDLQHEQVREMLPEYAMLQLSGAPPGSCWDELESHLASCDECRDALNELRQILLDTYSGQLEPTQPTAEPDLSFLPPPPAARYNPVAALADRATANLDTALDLARQVVIQFTEPLIAHLRQPVLAGGYRGTHYCSYEHPRQQDDSLHVTIDISTIDPERTLCRVLVCVMHPARPFDHEGSQVRLHFGTFTREAATDHQGFAPFDSIPLEFVPQLQFTILPQHSD